MMNDRGACVHLIADYGPEALAINGFRLPECFGAKLTDNVAQIPPIGWLLARQNGRERLAQR
jgi:hypothetical protein